MIEIEVAGASLGERKKRDEILQQMNAYATENDVFLQLFDARYVLGKEHLLLGYEKAEECFDNGTNRAEGLEIETLLWCSGERQIKDALDKMGIPEEPSEVVILIEGGADDFIDHMEWSRDDELVEPSLEKLKAFGLTEKEINSTEKPFDLVFEKMAASVL